MSALPASARPPLPPIRSGEGRPMAQFLDPQYGRPAVKLLPADYYAGRGEVAVVTVLGSCVAACLRDPIARVGGMNHFMLPEGAAAGEDARYGGYLMEVLINALLKLGARRDRIEAKVFGGGNVLQGFTANPVGTRNADFVLAYLAAERIAVVAEDLRGIHPRKLCYFPDTGAAKVKRLPHAHDAELVQQERSYRTRLSERAPAAGSVELFD